MQTSRTISGEHRTVFYLEVLHAIVVVIVVVAATLIYLLAPTRLPSDLLGFVYGGAITYAGGRAAQARAVLTRRQDVLTKNGNGEADNGNVSG